MKTQNQIVSEMINEKRITAFFQPIHNIKTGEIKYEVLARGIDNHEIISPFFFLNTAKELSLLETITDLIIDKAFRKFSCNDSHFNINLTQEDLSSLTLVEKIENKISQYGMDSKRITFEILEDVVITNDSLIIIENCKALRALGCKIALDDFGTGNSNLDRLFILDVDCVKFDKVFLNDLHDTKKFAFFNSLIVYVKSMGMTTLVEGVETIEVLNIIATTQIDYVQGYIFGKPDDCLDS